MNSKYPEICAVKPGSVVLMYDRKSIGFIIGKCKDLIWHDTTVDMYHILWVNHRGTTDVVVTWKPDSWINDVVVYMTPSQEKAIYAVKPGCTVLMYDKFTIGMIVGKYKRPPFARENPNKMEYCIMYARRGKIRTLTTCHPLIWVNNVVV